MNLAGVVWTIIGGGDTQTLLAGTKIELYALSGAGDTKPFLIFPNSLVLALSLALVPNHEPPGETFTT